MPAINRIHICGFKAFPNDFELQLEGKNLLMYGENGSGKSSIYYALHCMFQAPLKPDAGKKYFDPASEQHLKNLNNLDADSKIWIDFDGRHPFIYNIDKEGYQFTLLGGKHPLPAQINGCFVNHQFLFHFFNFRNSQRINLFPVFIKDILPFCKDDHTGLHIGEMYDEITASNFGKLSDVAHQGDVALGVINLVFESVGVLAVFAARRFDIKDIVLTGNLTTIPQAKPIFENLSQMFGVNILVPENAQYGTVIGAALSGVREKN